MKVKATKVKCKELKAGDLFSAGNQKDWDDFMEEGVGTKVFIRTNTVCPPDQAELDIYKITLKK